MGRISHASIISEDRDEGLVGSLAIYIGAIAVVFAMLATPVYLLSTPTQIENHGMAAYVAPPGTRLLPLPLKEIAAVPPATRVSVVTPPAKKANTVAVR